MIEPVPPQDEDAEQAVIGAALLDSRGADLALQAGIQPRCFYFETHRHIWAAVQHLRDQGQPTDPISVNDLLRKQGHEKAAAIVKPLLVAATTWTNVEHHAGIVLETWRKRGIIRSMQEVKQAAYNGKPPDELVASAFMKLDELERVAISRPTLTLMDLAAEYDRRLKNPPDENAGVPTPFTFLPDMHPGRLYVLGGYQKDGKSAMALQFALHAARAGKTVGIVSMEMNESDVFDRMVAAAGVPYGDVQKARIPGLYMDRTEKALAELAVLPIHVIPDPTITPATVSAVTRRHKWDLLVIDHLHRNDYQDRLEFEQIVRQITNIALSQNVPILLLAQLKRPEQGKPHRPNMQSLRESGMIEAEASAVWLIYRERDENQIPGRDTEFIIAASRYTDTGKYRLSFDGSFQRFEEPEGETWQS